MCKVDGCDNFSNRKAADLCEKHYMRLRRNGTFDKVQKRNKTYKHSGGYIKQYSPDHPLSDCQGYVYQHRMVYFDQVSEEIASCSLCERRITWATVHIDHIDKNKENNTPLNLRPLCLKCNTQRDRPKEMLRRKIKTLTINGREESIHDWIAISGQDIAYTTIYRRLKSGMSDYDALYSPKITHNGK